MFTLATLQTQTMLLQTVQILTRQLKISVSSGSTLFAILFWFLTETPIWNIGAGKIQTWKSIPETQGLKD